MNIKEKPVTKNKRRHEIHEYKGGRRLIFYDEEGNPGVFYSHACGHFGGHAVCLVCDEEKKKP